MGSIFYIFLNAPEFVSSRNNVSEIVLFDRSCAFSGARVSLGNSKQREADAAAAAAGAS